MKTAQPYFFKLESSYNTDYGFMKLQKYFRYWILVFLFLPFALNGQENYTVSGVVSDVTNGEFLIGATVYVPVLEAGAAANEYGYYSITLPEGYYTIRVSYLGYKISEFEIDLRENLRRNIGLELSSETLEEVVVVGDRADENIRSPEMSVSKLEIKEVRAIPVLFGEQDILKTIQLLPGVQSAGEGGSGYYVRGGDSGQNLILLDEATVYNPSHLLGFFSVFNSDAISDVKLYKGGIPAEYGGRIASALDVKMKNGSNQQYGLSGGLGLISSRLMVEGPIKKDVGSFMFTGRRTYADLFLALSRDTLIRNNSLYFYDLNLKANYKLGENDRLFLSGYFGRDVFLFQDRFGIDWGNLTGTLRWNHIFNSGLFLNSSIIYSKYNYVFKVKDGENDLDIASSIQDINLKESFQYYVNPQNTLKFGFRLNYHCFIPGSIAADGSFGINDIELSKKYAIESALYITHFYEPTSWLSLSYGLRLSSYFMIGPGNVYSFDEDGSVIDTTYYKSGELISKYIQPEPRLSLNFRVGPVSSVKLSYNRLSQYLHLLSNSSSGSPMDLWIPSSNIVKPQLGDQIAMGYFRNFKDNQWETSLEIYYKYMTNQIDYKNGADILLNELVESQLEFGKGWSYGMELFVKRKTGSLHGWLSYTLSRTEKQFDNINEGEVYPARQDRIHDISLVAIYDLSKRWSFSGTWVFYTGNAVTFPSGKYQIEGRTVNMYTERNGYRMPPYHRLDLSATRNNKKTSRRFESSWNFSIYNVYARKNAYSISFVEDENDPTKTNAVRLSLFSIIPSVSYNFKF